MVAAWASLHYPSRLSLPPSSLQKHLLFSPCIFSRACVTPSPSRPHHRHTQPPSLATRRAADRRGKIFRCY
ncbi:hypothetical protein E2C01_039028 [Portunus trituberculatus]|uniref:Uncharacterized protein n=1 Tax=Portunus trituberculatus TaxID=210409 RepID=A0A5B7FFR8_PORTR|nr:hypothetical protein [Portunus trituberculatus]